MSITRDRGTVVIQCDAKGCHETFEGTKDFRETIADAKNHGWLVKREGEDFAHYCSQDCFRELR